MRVAGPTDAEFGVVIACAANHLHLARAACASVRHFMGETPICVFFDGRRSTADLERAYGLRVVRPREVEHDELRELSFGSFLTKLNSFWLAPYASFLYLDADAVVWGDFRRRLPELQRFDVAIDRPIANDYQLRLSTMNPEAVARHFPDFDVVGHWHEYANSGAFYARRGVLDLDRYLELVRFSRAHPRRVFKTDQGIFNFMLFSAADAGSIRLGQLELQVLGQDTRALELRRLFRFENGAPVVTAEPRVLHWNGWEKPRMKETARDYFEPANHFRREHLRARGEGRIPPGLRLRLEDLPLELAHRRGQLVQALRYQPRRARLALEIRRRRLADLLSRSS